MAIDYSTLRNTALADLQNYMDSLGEEKGKKLAYWIKDYTNFLSQEASFQPKKLIRYKRGAIVKVHLGYRIGSEEGGLHYAIVMDRNNSIHSPTVTVIPLTSVKSGVDLSQLPRARVSIGNELYSLLITNYDAEIRSAKRHLKDLKNKIDQLNDPSQSTDEQLLMETILSQIAAMEKQISYCERMKRETNRMKVGSIALVGQITTVSKIRIYDPKYNNDALSKIRISPATLDILDERVQELYGAPRKK